MRTQSTWRHPVLCSSEAIWQQGQWLSNPIDPGKGRRHFPVAGEITMKRARSRLHCAVFGLLQCCFVSAAAEAQPSAPVPVDPRSAVQSDLQGPELLEEGPLHEAYAKPLALEDHAVVIDRLPPAAVNELPPEQRPEGPNVNWLPGYWFFDSDRNDFVWVSGLWRNFPPGRNWVPGEWQQVPGGYQWVSGYWAAQQVQQSLLPTPPATLEQGPSSPAPADGHLWTPGCWQWQGSRYAWQSGFWYAAQPDWVWMPNHYCYTPKGAVYVCGYWDHPLARRGSVYAPVFWRAGYPSGTAVYRPRTVINTNRLIAHLIVDHHHGGYYYGNHRSSEHNLRRGLATWNDGSYGRRGHSQAKFRIHDPLSAHFRRDGHRHGADGQKSSKPIATGAHVHSKRAAGATRIQSGTSLLKDRGRHASGDVGGVSRQGTRLQQDSEAARRAAAVSQQRNVMIRRQTVNDQPRQIDRDRQRPTLRSGQNFGSGAGGVSSAGPGHRINSPQPLMRTKLRPDVRPRFSQRVVKPAASARSGNESSTPRVSQTKRSNRGQAVRRQPQAKSQFRRSNGNKRQQKAGRGGGKRGKR